jgi:predicted MPP superfamily phosphohydrolase
VFDIQGNLVSHTITLRPAINLLVLTLLHYLTTDVVLKLYVAMFKLEVTYWSISELSMYFKISHKNKSVHKLRIAHFPDLFSNHMFILGRIDRIEKAVKHLHAVTQKFVDGKKLPPII